MNVNEANQIGDHELKAPASTAWPVVLAFGFTLMFAGLLTNVSISLLGAVLAFCGSAGWLREVFPHEHEITVAAQHEDDAVETSRPIVERFPLAEAQRRAWLPLETYPVSAGLRGGIVGSAAMAIVACVFGLLHVGSIWYPINLLAAVLYSQSQSLSEGQLNAFHANSFLIATLLHLLGSALVGLVYGAMLPMIPRHPIFLGGVIAPVLWSSLLHSMLDLINPMLGKRVDWVWFIASQFAFGIVAGLVVVRQQRVPVKQFIPFAVRAGIEARGTRFHEEGEDK